MQRVYRLSEINEMNSCYPWDGSIRVPMHASLYKLYATGDFSLSVGRIYVALPHNVAISPAIVRDYNLML